MMMSDNEESEIVNNYRNDIIDTPVANTTIEEIVQSKISKNMRELKNFFNNKSFVTEKGSQSTNIINVGEKKTFHIPPTHEDEFFTIMEKCRKEKLLLHFGERQETDKVKHTGIMIDIDRYQSEKDSCIKDHHYNTMTTVLITILTKYLDLETHSENGLFRLRVFYIKKTKVVLSKESADGNIYKDGFHALIPEVMVSKAVKKQIFKDLREKMGRVFCDLKNIEPPENMLDMMSATNLVQFFGSSKVGHVPYFLHAVHDTNVFLSDIMSSDRVSLKVADLLEGKTPCGKEINLTYEMSLGFMTNSIEGKTTWLQKRVVEPRNEYVTQLQLLMEKTQQDILNDDEILGAENSVDILTMGNAEAKYLKNILAILDPSYATDYDKWFKVICALAHTNNNYRPLAVWFSQRSPQKLSEAAIDKVWSEASRRTGTPITKRSLIYWAKESSPAKFREIEKENYVELLAKYTYQNEGRVEHSMVAKIIHAMCGDKFVVDVAEKRYHWLEYVTPGQSMKHGEVWKWRREADPDNIHLFIAEHLPRVYADQLERIKDRKDNALNEQIGKYWSSVEKTFRNYMSKLSNDTFQNGVVKQAQYRFRHRGFIEELDSYENVIGVGNGVLVTGASPRLITGFHEYKISKYTETNYIPYNPEDPIQKKVLQWSRDIFVEPDVNLFMWCHASTGVSSYESACILLMLVAGGQNGKTSWAKMVHNTLGNMYAASGKPALLVSSTERGESANSAQMQMRGKTFFYMDEFTKSSTINDARLKSIVTPGWQSGRDLHEKQSNFKNTCNPFVLSNFDFFLETQDHGTWRRIYYYKNKCKFTKKPDPANPYEKLAEGAWESTYPNDPEYRAATLAILVHYNKILWTKYGGDIKNIPVPTIVRETENFRNKQDTLNSFITQMVVKSPGAEPLSLPTIAQRYINWHNMNIKHAKNMEPLAVQADVENSRLSSEFVYDGTGVKFVRNYRIRNTADEPLFEGEAHIGELNQGNDQPIDCIQPNDNLPNNILHDNIDLDKIREEENKVDRYIVDLIKRVPLKKKEEETGFIEV